MFRIFAFFFLVSIICQTGCNRHCSVTGKVSYPDGSPLTMGTVVFSTSVFQAKGPIRSDGTYAMGSIKPGDGVPAGSYNVHIEPAVVTIPTTVASQDGKKVKTTIQTKKIVDPKFARAMESGILCDVKRSMIFDFTVEPPKN